MRSTPSLFDAVLGTAVQQDESGRAVRVPAEARWAIYAPGSDEPLQVAGRTVVLDVQTWFAARALARTYTADDFEVRRYAPEHPPERVELVRRTERAPTFVTKRRIHLRSRPA